MSVKVFEAREHCKAAEKFLKTSLLRWKPDYDSAADEYSQAAQCYRIARDAANSKDCHLKASECYKKNNAFFHAAKALENAVLVCKDTATPQETGMNDAIGRLKRCLTAALTASPPPFVDTVVAFTPPCDRTGAHSTKHYSGKAAKFCLNDTYLHAKYRPARSSLPPDPMAVKRNKAPRPRPRAGAETCDTHDLCVEPYDPLKREQRMN
ncbi:unnamed protein product [Spodoptera exigua]|nr:unnamed protein product [Spodoptera exigua]